MKILKKLFGQKQKQFILNLDRPRELKYDFFAIGVMTRTLKIRDLKALLDLDVSQIPTMAWAGMLWEDPQLTVRKVEKMIKDTIANDEYKLGQIAKTVIDAIADAYRGFRD
jgi:hypothetical protein